LPELQFPAASYILIIASAFSFVLAHTAWEKRPASGAAELMVILLGCGIWSLTYGIEQMLVTLSGKTVATIFTYIGILILPAAWFAFGIRYAGKGAWLSTWKAAWLFIMPVLTLIALATNPLHHLYYLSSGLEEINGFQQHVVVHGPFFWLHTIYSYALLIVGTVVLLRSSLSTPSIYKRQSWILVLGALIPWAANGLFLLNLFPSGGIDPTPISFTLSGLIFIVGLYRFRVLDLAPIARERIVEVMDDGVIVLDKNNRIVDCNPVAGQLLGAVPAKIIGLSVDQFLNWWPELAHYFGTTGEVHEPVSRSTGGRTFYYDLRVTPLYSGNNQSVGHLILLRDITPGREAEDEIRRMAAVEHTQREVADALFETSKTLSESLDFETVLDCLLEQLARVVPYDSGAVMLVKGDQAVFSRWRGYERFNHHLPEVISQTTFDLQNTANLKWMLEHKAPFIVADTHAVPSWVQTGATDYIHSWIGAPIISRGQVTGFFSLDKVQPGYYTPEHGQTLAALAAQAGVAMQNAGLFAETHDLLRREQQLNNILQIIGSSMDLSIVLNDILCLSCELIGADVGILGLMNMGGDQIEATNAYNIDLQSINQPLKQGQGLSWEVIHQKKGALIRYYGNYHGAQEILRSTGVHSALIAPVRAGEEILGILSFYTTSPDKVFLDRDLPLIEAIGREAGVSIQNSRLFTSAQRRAEEAETVREAVSAVSSALELNGVLDQIITNLERVVPFDSCAVFLQEGDKLRIVAAHGFPNGTRVIGKTYTLDNTLTIEAFRTAKAVILPDASQDPRFAGWGDSTHVRGWMGVPLLTRGAITGLLTIDSRTVDAYTEADAAIAQTFANQAAIAIENARLFEKVQHLAITDPLTELYNRRHFFELARREFYRARRYSTPLSLLMLDMDDLKLVNDSYGHQTGDLLVEFIGNQCRSQLRQVDIPARYAGDEFIIALPETPLAGAVQVAMRIRERIAAGFFVDGINLVPAFVTIGVSESDASCFSLETLINHADQALYAAKQAGKNQICTWNDGLFEMYRSATPAFTNKPQTETAQG
jgi:diguanylate cyclase (GGDEF)-like protein/PAS domain S-box-containing protein